MEGVEEIITHLSKGDLRGVSEKIAVMRGAFEKRQKQMRKTSKMIDLWKNIMDGTDTSSFPEHILKEFQESVKSQDFKKSVEILENYRADEMDSNKSTLDELVKLLTFEPDKVVNLQETSVGLRKVMDDQIARAKRPRTEKTEEPPEKKVNVEETKKELSDEIEELVKSGKLEEADALLRHAEINTHIKHGQIGKARKALQELKKPAEETPKISVPEEKKEISEPVPEKKE